MKITTIYRITSHKQHVEVDDTSISPNKVSNQVLLFEGNIPDDEVLKGFLAGNSAGTLLAIDQFCNEPIQTFDSITGSDCDLKVLKTLEISNAKAILCLPEDFLTFFIGQKLVHLPKIFTARVVTLSDRAHRGVHKDTSGPAIAESLSRFFEKGQKKILVKHSIIPDNASELSIIIEECKVAKTDILITTGGTGIGQRDITVETVKSHLEKEIPGIMEMIRVKYGAKYPSVLLNRGMAGTVNRTLVYTLPGNPEIAENYLTEIFVTLDLLLNMIHGIDTQ